MNTINNTSRRMMKMIACVAFGLMFLVGTGVAQQSPTTKKPTSKSTKAKTATGKKAAAASKDATPSAQIDKPNLDTKPGPLQATTFAFPPYIEFTMPNGLHVYVIENHEQPTLNVGISIRGGDAYDPAGKEGTAAIMGDMLGKGTKSRTASAMAEALDGVGAGISVTTAGESMGVSASMLKKHMNVVFPILRDQLQEPTFDEQELAKLKKQYVASIASRRSRPNEIAQALSRKVIYGMNNPLARRTLEKTINAVTREDVVAFHDAYIRPNLASIAFVGDITEKEAREIVTKYFNNWKKGTAPAVEIPPMRTEPAGVYFVPRKGSVQSTVIISAAGPAVRESDYDATDILTSYIGGGFGSVLFNTLRETYSYTYSPFSVLTRGRRYNRIAFGAEVRNSVTDSAITVMMRELAKLANEGPDDESLARRVATEVGQYQLAFEQAGTVGAVLQNAWLNDVPIEDVTSYTERLVRINSGDVQQAAAKYLSMFNLRLIVVGSPDVKSKIEQFGPIKEFTLDLEPMQDAAFENVGMTPQQLVEKHIEALGGRAAVDAVKSMTMKADVSMTLQGNELSGTYERIVATPNKEYTSVNLGMMTQQQWVNGSTSWMALNGGSAGEQEATDTKKALLEARIFPFASALADGYTLVVKGKKDNSIVVEATSPLGRSERYMLDANTMLVSKIEKDDQTPQGVMTTVEKYEAYETIGGVKLPTQITQSNAIFSMTLRAKVSVNDVVSDTTFAPSK